MSVDPEETVAEAVAVRAGKILRVGSNEEIDALAKSSAKVIDLGGRTLLPGFVDSHEHVMRRGLMMDWVNCRSPPVETIQDIIDGLASKAAGKPEGEWVVGSWFDETKLSDGRWPTRYDLDEASDRHPIYLGRAGGHTAVANSLALEATGITKDTPQPEGGHIGMDESGEPTGRLDEIAAMNMVRGRIPQPDAEETVRLMVENWSTIEEMLLSWGITTVHEAHIKAPEALAYQELDRVGRMRTRVGLMLDGMAPYKGYATGDLARQGLRTGFGWSDRLYVIGVKIGVDGAMGSLTASLREPYANDPENYGINRVTQEELTRETVELHGAGNRACIHAIGDWAIDIALNAVEEAVDSAPREDHRHRIEHAGYVRPDQLERMARLGVAVSASIGFCHPIGDSHIAALGEDRLCGYYPMKSFQEHGIVAGGNSDGFGENWPITGIAGCVTRRSSGGEYLCREQAISVMDAIRAYTVNGAFLEGTEDEKGSLKPGKLADMVVLDRDILTVDPLDIVNTRVLMTVVGGEVVYERDS
ncbi:amidohydrolase [Candidatus Bathyarchaeota archaeon]|nr:amidohydrolase [Candidatus Bathyarchaeota archaeon]MBL7078762.1 amidohydrolase [Candidatus Bathyarchaeota archaeon]